MRKILGLITVGILICINAGYGQRLNPGSFSRINTSYDELNPVIAPDGQTLFITIANHPANVGGKKDPGDIWISTLASDGNWSAPVHAGASINSSGFNAVGGVSADGSRLFLLSHYAPGGNVRTQGISVSVKRGAEWSTPENISIPYFQNKAGILNGHVLPDQSVFVFSADTYGTRGVEDIYVTVNTGSGKWSEPKNLGSVINTQFQELSPSLSSDGKTLYFSSNGRKGSGSFDIYSSVRLDDSWTQWSVPVNMGGTFNTEGRELFFRMYDKLGYAVYSSSKNSDGYGDIRVFLSDEPFRKDSMIVQQPAVVDSGISIVEVPRVPAGDKKVTVRGKVTNAKTGEPIDAAVLFVGAGNSETSRAVASTGYAVQIPSTSEYTVKIEAQGYVSAMEKLDIHTYEMPELEMNFKLQPVEIGTKVNLKDVLFEQGRTNLLSQSYPELDLVVSFLKANPKVRIELSGHTDNRGIPGQNVKLSQSRVDKVKDYLVSKGVEKRRISGKGYGGSQPIASNDSEETRQLNRRVEFTIKKF